VQPGIGGCKTPQEYAREFKTYAFANHAARFSIQSASTVLADTGLRYQQLRRTGPLCLSLYGVSDSLAEGKPTVRIFGIDKSM
jgi:hypothetical protein